MIKTAGSDLSMISTYYFDRDLRMFLPAGKKHDLDRNSIKIDEKAQVPRDRAGLSFKKVKGKNLYIAASELATA